MSDSTYSEGPVMRIFNVHWDDGLAVEFGAGAEDAPKPDLKQQAKE